jgi:hypothetical protein
MTREKDCVWKHLIENNTIKSIFYVSLLLVVFMYVDRRHFFDIPRKLEDRPFLYQTMFYLNYLGLLLSCLIYLTVKSKVIRVVFSLLILITVAITIVMDQAHGNVFSKLEANILFTEIQFAGQAMDAFFYSYLKGVLLALALTSALVFIAQLFLPKIDNWYALIPIVFIAFSTKLHLNSGGWHTLFPSVFNVPIIATDAYLTIPRFGPRNAPFIKPENKGLFKHIIWIVDESVRGDMLGINGAKHQTTPFLKSIKNSYYNYGIMSSASQYSLGSNLVLQSGLRLDQLPDTNMFFGTNPDIYQYGKQAGYTTYFINGQNKEDLPTNGMTRHDFKNIDHYIAIHKEFPGIVWPQVDTAIVGNIKSILESKKNTFTYINKAGCHFAYTNFYPKLREIFKPSYKGGEMWDNATTLKNTYCNCISWSVDEFFRKLVPNLKDKDVIVIYTSDHGVSLLEKGRPVQDISPINPLPIRAAVPFLVFTGNKHPELFQYAENNLNKLSHFSIFPSTLHLMGYKKEEVNARYGMDFFTKIKSAQRYFFSGSMYDPPHFYLNKFYYKLAE